MNWDEYLFKKNENLPTIVYRLCGSSVFSPILYAVLRVYHCFLVTLFHPIIHYFKISKKCKTYFNLLKLHKILIKRLFMRADFILKHMHGTKSGASVRKGSGRPRPLWQHR